MISNREKINLGKFLESLRYVSKETLETMFNSYEIAEEKMKLNYDNFYCYASSGLSSIIYYKAWHILAMILNTNLLFAGCLTERDLNKEDKNNLLQVLAQSGKTTGYLLCDQALWWNTLTAKEIGVISFGLNKNPLPQSINQYILNFVAVDKVDKELLKPFLPALKNIVNETSHNEMNRWFPEYIKILIDLCVYNYRIYFKFDFGREFTKHQIQILKENLKIELRKLDYCQFCNNKFKNILIDQFKDAGRKQKIFNKDELLLLLERAQAVYTSSSMLENGIFKKKTRSYFKNR